MGGASRGCSDDTVYYLKFRPWRPEVEHATSRYNRKYTISVYYMALKVMHADNYDHIRIYIL